MRRFGIVLAALLVTYPAETLAQRAAAGLVVASDGYVTAARHSGGAPIPLKFRDEISFDDRIVTGDGSSVRLLIDRKALVALQERTVVTIIRVGGRSTIQLESGRMALALAAEKLRSGESIHLATPNAVARLEGARIVAQVMRLSAEAGSAVPAVVTHFYVLNGAIEATHLGSTARVPIGATMTADALTRFSAGGRAPAAVTPIPPSQLPAVTRGFARRGFGYGYVPDPPYVRQRAVDVGVSLLSQVSDAMAERGRAAMSPFALESDARWVRTPLSEELARRAARDRSDAPVASVSPTAAPAPISPVAPTISPSVGSLPSPPQAGAPSPPGAPVLPPQAVGPNPGSGGNGHGPPAGQGR